MSYEIIKSIKVKDNKVFLASSSNNVSPKYFNEWECKSLTKILQDKGRDALDLEILKQYESGNFQRGNNRYTRALHVLRHMPEHKNFDWRCGWGAEYDEVEKRRQTEEFDMLLLKAMKTLLPREKYVLTCERGANDFYMKITRHRAKYRTNKSEATIFRYQGDAKSAKKNFTGGNDWEVIKLI